MNATATNWLTTSLQREAKWLITEAKWTTAKHYMGGHYSRALGKRVPRTSYTTMALAHSDADRLAEWVEVVIDYDGGECRDKIEACGNMLAVAVLREMGYDLRADADYDTVVTQLGENAERIYVEVCEIVDYLDDEHYIGAHR